MTSAREATFELFRAHGLSTVLGSPGSKELPMLVGFPADVRYVVGQEGVVVGMADGYAQATDFGPLVNLHSAPGVATGVGTLVNSVDVDPTRGAIGAGRGYGPLMSNSMAADQQYLEGRLSY